MIENCYAIIMAGVIGSRFWPISRTNHSKSDKLIVIVGLEDYIVVDQKNVFLICKKENEQMIKKYTKDLKETKGEDFV